MNPLAMQISFPKGDPNGIKIIELTGWNGKAVIVPRTEVSFLKERSEISASGLYFLFGEDEETGNQLVYIGESGDCSTRLNTHDSEKDYWNQALIFLDPPDRNFLESISTKLAKEAARYIVKNSKQPKEEKQNEFNRILNERYFDGVKMIFSTFGYPLFESVRDAVSSSKLYYLKGEGSNAKAQLLEDGTLNVLAGSLARKNETKAFWGWSKAARIRFLEEGSLKDSGDGISYVYTKDILFNSPSAAAATTLGSPANGWTVWKDENGNSLDENLRK
jgi:hypothetical protein